MHLRPTGPIARLCLCTRRGRYASAGTSNGPVSICPSVCHKSVLYRNVWTDRAGFWQGAFLDLAYTVLQGN